MAEVAAHPPPKKADSAAAAAPPRDPTSVKKVFFLIFFTNLLINFDSGAVPSALLAIDNELDMGYSAQGALGGNVYLGLSMACLGAGNLLHKYPQRRVVAVFTALNAVMMVIFGMSTSTWLLLTARFCTGLSQAFLVIFSPVWVDEFAPKAQQTLYMSLLQLAPALGIMIGYVMGIMAGEGEIFPRWSAWRLPFICQGLIMLPAAIGIGCLPAHLIETSNQSSEVPNNYDSHDNLEAPEIGRPSAHLEDEDEHSVEAEFEDPNRFDDSNSISISLDQEIDLHIANKLPPYDKSPRESITVEDANGVTPSQKTRGGQKSKMKAKSEGGYYSPQRSPQRESHSRSGQQPSAFALTPPSSRIGTAASSIAHRRTSVFTDATSDGMVSDASGVPASVNRTHHLILGTSVLGRPMVSEFDMTPAMGLVSRKRREPSSNNGGSPIPSSPEVSQLPPIEEGVQEEGAGPNSCSMLQKLMRNGVFISTMMALAALYFVVTGIQFWVTPYCVTVLGAGIGATGGSFVAISATAPTIGVVFGGWITDKRGGYQGHEQAVKTLKLNVVFCFLAMVFCFLTTVFSDLTGVMPCLTVTLFFGAAVVPSSTGIVIDAVEPEERAFSSAMSQMGCNILGYALAPFLSGFVAEMAGGPEGLKWGFRLVCWWGAFSFIFMLLAVHNSTKRLKSAEGDVKKDDREEVDVEVEEEDESGPSAVSPRGRKAPVTGLSLMTGPVSGKTLAHHRNSSE